MAFDNMPDLGPMRLPGAPEYGAASVAGALKAAETVPHKLDIAYGDDPFQQLDVWYPAHAKGKLPVVVFIHGGAWRNGHKEWNGIMAPLITGLPAILVSLNYRLVPKVKFPAPVDDCFDGLAWVYRNIAQFGGDPDRLHIGGHSAGGHLAAMLALNRPALKQRGIPVEAIRLCSPVSGLYTFLKEDLTIEGVRTTFWDQMFADEAAAAAASCFQFTDDNRVPFHLIWGGADLAELIPDNARLAAIAAQKGFLLGVEVQPGLDHFGAHMDCLRPDSAYAVKLKEVFARDSK